MKKTIYFPMIVCLLLLVGYTVYSNNLVKIDGTQETKTGVSTKQSKSSLNLHLGDSKERIAAESSSQSVDPKELSGVNSGIHSDDIKEVPNSNLGTDRNSGLRDPKALAGLNSGINPDDIEEWERINKENASRVSVETESAGKKHRLSVQEQVQEVWNYCAPTTVSMMLSVRGVEVDQYQLAKEMGTYEPFGTHNRDAIRILNKHLFGYEMPQGSEAGYRLATVTNADANSEDMRLFKERVKQNIKDGYPLYYTLDVAKILPGKSGEHNVVGTGYVETPDGKDIALLYYVDPSPLVQDPTYKGLKIISPEELLDAIVSCQEPNYAW